MKVAPLLAALLIATLTAPTSPAEGEATAAAWRNETCSDDGCSMLLQARLTVTGCDQEGCDFVVNVSNTGTDRLPGLLYVSTILHVSDGGTGGGICLGPQLVNDAIEPYVPCGKLCEKYTIGQVVKCSAMKQARVSAPRGGPCNNGIWISGIYFVNLVFFTAGSLTFDVCQNADGTAEIRSYNEHTS